MLTPSFRLYCKKLVQTKMSMRGPLKTCGNRNVKIKIAEIGNHVNNIMETR